MLSSKEDIMQIQVPAEVHESMDRFRAEMAKVSQAMAPLREYLEKPAQPQKQRIRISKQYAVFLRTIKK
jgi:hypothetical protein